MAHVFLKNVSVSFPNQATAPYSVKEALIGLVVTQKKMKEDIQPGLRDINLDLKEGTGSVLSVETGLGKARF